MNSDPSNLGLDEQFPSEVEEDVNMTFEKLFSGHISTSDVVNLLSSKRKSVSSSDQNFFACFINNLFDECRFLSKYPDNELMITASLFGNLINNQLISNVPLSVALKYILEAIKKPPGQKLFKFGITALLQFQNRLSEWPEFCNLLILISHLQQVHPELFSYIKHCIAANIKKEPALVASPDGASVFGIIKTIKSDSPEPSDTLKDRCLFILNNLSFLNIEEKLEDFKQIVSNISLGWLSFYLVSSRACIEPNLHELYINFIDLFSNASFEILILKQTYSIISTVLFAPIKEPSSSDRSAVRNIGSWLGSLTLSRNRPILHRDLSLKNLISSAMEGGKLSLVLPFVCKVLEQSVKSVVFRPFNSWLINHLRLLSELYFFSDLKLNLKFEIEVLCKNIGIEIKNIEPSYILRQSSSDKQKNIATLTLPLKSSELHLHFIEKLGMKPELYKYSEIISLAFEIAIRDIFPHISERSITIARASSLFFIGKELEYLDDPSYFSECVASMFLGLVRSLSSVTAKEPFKQSFMNSIQTFVSKSKLMPLDEPSLRDIVIEFSELGASLVIMQVLKVAEYELQLLIDRNTHPAIPYSSFPTIYFEYSSINQFDYPSEKLSSALSFDPVSNDESELIYSCLTNYPSLSDDASSSNVDFTRMKTSLVDRLKSLISKLHDPEPLLKANLAEFSSCISDSNLLSDEDMSHLASKIILSLCDQSEHSVIDYLGKLLNAIFEVSHITMNEVRSLIFSSDLVYMLPMRAYSILSPLLISHNLADKLFVASSESAKLASFARIKESCLVLPRLGILLGLSGFSVEMAESPEFETCISMAVLNCERREERELLINFIVGNSRLFSDFSRFGTFVKSSFELSLESYIQNYRSCKILALKKATNFAKFTCEFSLFLFKSHRDLAKNVLSVSLNISLSYLVKALSHHMTDLYIPISDFLRTVFCHALSFSSEFSEAIMSILM